MLSARKISALLAAKDQTTTLQAGLALVNKEYGDALFTKIDADTNGSLSTLEIQDYFYAVDPTEPKPKLETNIKTLRDTTNLRALAYTTVADLTGAKHDKIEAVAAVVASEGVEAVAEVKAADAVTVDGPDGNVSRAEFEATVNIGIAANNALAAEAATKIFNDADTTTYVKDAAATAGADKSLDLEELKKVAQIEEQYANYDLFFKHADADKNGLIDQTEFNTFASTPFPEAKKEAAKGGCC